VRSQLYSVCLSQSVQRGRTVANSISLVFLMVVMSGEATDVTFSPPQGNFIQAELAAARVSASN
jgi:hypothetical protein